jgi:ferredoxin
MSENPKDPANPSGPVQVGDWKVHVDRDMCIGAGTCVALAMQAFHLDSENKAIITDTIDQETKETILEGAKSCPVAAVIIEDMQGNKVYPK